MCKGPGWTGNRNSQEAGVAGRQAEGDEGGGVGATWVLVGLGGLWGLFVFKILFIFRERGREGERKGNTDVWLPLQCPLLGTWPATQECTLTGN